jgi:cytochrome P450
MVAARKRYRVYAQSQAMARTQASIDRKDFFHCLLHAKDPDTGAGFSMPVLWAEAGLLIVAGSDTSSTALAATFFYLAHNPS